MNTEQGLNPIDEVPLDIPDVTIDDAMDVPTCIAYIENRLQKRINARTAPARAAERAAKAAKAKAEKEERARLRLAAKAAKEAEDAENKRLREERDLGSAGPKRQRDMSSLISDGLVFDEQAERSDDDLEDEDLEDEELSGTDREATDLIADDDEEDLRPTDPSLYRYALEDDDEVENVESLVSAVAQRDKRRTRDATSGGGQDAAPHPIAGQEGRLFFVTVMPGFEMSSQILLSHVVAMEQAAGKDTGITAVMAVPGLTGAMYVEAHNQTFVEKALRLAGIPAPGRTRRRASGGPAPERVRPVELLQHADVFMSGASEPPLNPGEFVRVKSGAFKGDLAQVVRTYHADKGQMVDIRVIPRIQDQSIPRRPGDRAPQLLLPVAELALRLGFPVLKDEADPTIIHLGRFSFDRGLLFKTLPRAAVTTDSLVATLAEREPFERALQLALEEAGRSEDDTGHVAALRAELDSMTRALIAQTKELYRVGDAVRVHVEGEEFLDDLEGTVHSIEGEMVNVLFPAGFGFPSDPLPFKAAQLQKFFRIGSHIAVTSGPHANTSGDVVDIDDTTGALQIKADVGSAIFHVDPNACLRTTRVLQPTATSAGLRAASLVEYGVQAEVGLLVVPGAQTCSVLSSDNLLISVEAADVRPRPRSQLRAVAIDSLSNPVNVSSRVRIARGQHRDMEGDVVQIHNTRKHSAQSTLFLTIRGAEFAQTSGYYAIPSSQVEVISASALAAMSLRAVGSLTPGGATPGSRFRATGRAAFGMAPGSRRTGPDSLLHKRIRVTQGIHKSMVGEVRSVTGDQVRVVLEAHGGKHVSLPKTAVQDITDRSFGAAESTYQNLSFSPSQVSFSSSQFAQAPFVASQSEADSGFGTMAAPTGTAGAISHSELNWISSLSQPTYAGGNTPAPGGNATPFRAAAPAASFDANLGWGDAESAQEEPEPEPETDAEAEMTPSGGNDDDWGHVASLGGELADAHVATAGPRASSHQAEANAEAEAEITAVEDEGFATPGLQQTVVSRPTPTAPEGYPWFVVKSAIIRRAVPGEDPKYGTVLAIEPAVSVRWEDGTEEQLMDLRYLTSAYDRIARDQLVLVREQIDPRNSQVGQADVKFVLCRASTETAVEIIATNIDDPDDFFFCQPDSIVPLAEDDLE
jgi:transcription antitermination factor NusG